MRTPALAPQTPVLNAILSPSEQPATGAVMPRLLRWFFILLTLGYAGMVLSLPLFPSQDGPVHLYYADICRELLLGGPDTVYSQFFALKQILPPYAFQPYSLLLLTTVFPAEAADKVLVAAYVVYFCFSFRYLVLSGACRVPELQFLAFPLVLNRLVYMGFCNFSLAVSTALLVIGFWLRHHERMKGRRTAVFLLLLLLLLFTHPVPMLVATGFLGLHTVARLVAGARCGQSARALWEAHRRECLHVATAGLSLVWIARFAAPTLTESPWFEWGQWQQRAVSIATGQILSPFQSTGYQLPLFWCATVVMLLAYRRLEARELTASAVALIACAGISLIVFLGAPFRMSGNGYFPERFPVFAAAFLTAVACGAPIARRMRALMGGFLPLVGVALLVWQAGAAYGLAARIDALARFHLPPGTDRVAIVSDSPDESDRELTFSPYMWAGAHQARLAKAVLVNSPWLDSSLLMIGPRESTPWIDFSPFQEMALLGRAGPALLPPVVIEVRAETPCRPRSLDRVLGNAGGYRQVLADDRFRIYMKTR